MLLHSADGADKTTHVHRLAADNTLVSINVVNLRQARLLNRWVTVFGGVNHVGAEPGTQV